MGKRLFLLFVVGIIGLISSPASMMATDFVGLNGVDDTKAVETVLLPDEPEPELEYIEKYSPNVGLGAPIAGQAVAPTPVIPENNIQINGRAIELVYTNSTGGNAGAATQAWYYSTGKFIYGHNYNHVFGSLDSAYDGGWLGGLTFSVTFNGVSSSYQVVNYRLYDYNPADMNNVYYNNQAISGYSFTGARMMNARGVAPEEYVNSRDDAFYDMALMTCYAGSSKRLVIFANRV